ncbi:MAG TPA: hypothetical protein ENN22_04185 [bacterium]|nr:hypothetical protein [bacterium]
MSWDLTFIEAFRYRKDIQSITITIAEISISLLTESSSIADFIKTRYQQFHASSEEPQYQIQIHLSAGLSFSSDNPNELFFNRQKFSKEKNFIYSNGYTGYLDKQQRLGKVVVSDDNAETWVEHYLRFAYSWMALQNRALLFHGAAIIRDDAGYVFFGPSNAGKTTITEFSSDYLILGDDMVVVREKPLGCEVYASPFNINLGKLKIANSNKRIQGFYRLHQDKKNFLQPMSEAKSLAELMSSVPLSSANFSGNLIAFERCRMIAKQIPCYNLHFTRDDSFWRIINGNF